MLHAFARSPAYAEATQTAQEFTQSGKDSVGAVPTLCGLCHKVYDRVRFNATSENTHYIVATCQHQRESWMDPLEPDFGRDTRGARY